MAQRSSGGFSHRSMWRSIVSRKPFFHIGVRGHVTTSLTSGKGKAAINLDNLGFWQEFSLIGDLRRIPASALHTHVRWKRLQIAIVLCVRVRDQWKRRWCWLVVCDQPTRPDPCWQLSPAAGPLGELQRRLRPREGPSRSAACDIGTDGLIPSH